MRKMFLVVAAVAASAFAADDAALMNKKSEFKAATKTRKAVHLTMVTSFGVKPNAYSGRVQSFATLDDLFAM